MRRLFANILLTAAACLVQARPFCIPAMVCPAAEPGVAVWFWRVVEVGGLPRGARAVVAADGFATLYVNGRNVGASVLSPVGPGGGLAAAHYEIGHLLVPGYNVIAVRAVPKSYGERPRVAVKISVPPHFVQGCGRQSHNGWLCLADGRLRMGGSVETVDGRLGGWRMAQDPPVSLSLPATADTISSAYGVEHLTEYNDGLRIKSVLPAEKAESIGDTAVLSFPRPFIGRVRVTLRGAARGDTVRVGALDYVCRGEQDEQACLECGTEPARNMAVCGSGGFNAGWIERAEGLEIGRAIAGTAWPEQPRYTIGREMPFIFW